MHWHQENLWATSILTTLPSPSDISSCGIWIWPCRRFLVPSGTSEKSADYFINMGYSYFLPEQLTQFTKCCLILYKIKLNFNSINQVVVIKKIFTLANVWAGFYRIDIHSRIWNVNFFSSFLLNHKQGSWLIKTNVRLSRKGFRGQCLGWPNLSSLSHYTPSPKHNPK